MDRPWTLTSGVLAGADRSAFTLPSREAALGVLRAAFDRGTETGPILLTGDSGVGKTWLCRRIQAELPANWRWLALDIAPGLDPETLHGVIGHELGVDLNRERVSTPPRLAVADFLVEAVADGESWALVLDEAQNASTGAPGGGPAAGQPAGPPGGFSGS